MLRVLLLPQSCSHKKKIEVPQVGPPPLSSSAVDPDPDRSELVCVIRKLINNSDPDPTHKYDKKTENYKKIIQIGAG